MVSVTWPRCLANDPLLFFSMPFIGKVARFKRSVKRELRNRSRVEWLESWKDCGITWRETALFLRIIVHLSYINWPNEHVGPDDVASVIMGYVGDSEMDDEDVLWPLLRMYGISTDSHAAELIQEAVFHDDCSIRSLWELIYANWD